MGFWGELGKAMLEGMDNAAQAQDPAVQARMKEHVIALNRLNRDSGTGNLASIFVESVASTAMMTSYLDKLPRKEVKVLGSYVRDKARQAKAAANEDRYDGDAKTLAARLEGMSEFLSRYTRNRAEEDD